MKMQLFLRILVGLSLFSGFVNAQKGFSFLQIEDSLKTLNKKIQKSDNDSVKIKLNLNFFTTLKEALTVPGAYHYPFDSIHSLGKIVSPDHKFRILNWNLLLQNGSNRYFAIIEMAGDLHQRTRYFVLTDVSDSMERPENLRLDADHWYGALYYKIIWKKCDTVNFYTLLGWDGYSHEMTQKIIDVLSFDPGGNPVFGAPLFRNHGNGKNMRILFKYSASGTMILRYEEQKLTTRKTWNPRKKVFEFHSEKADLIVCDRLIPIEPSFEGVYQFYVPAGDVYDGFIFTKCAWEFVEKVDARNN
jgi:hypothetical protein